MKTSFTSSNINQSSSARTVSKPAPPVQIAAMQIHIGSVTEQMSKEVMELCLQALAQSNISDVYIYGDMSSLNNDSTRMMEEMAKMGRNVWFDIGMNTERARDEWQDFFKEYGISVLPADSFIADDAGPALFCRNTLSVNASGYVYDCDSAAESHGNNHLKDLDLKVETKRKIAIDPECCCVVQQQL